MDEEKYFQRIAEYKLLAKHEVGQNFLIDAEAAKKIVDLAEISSDDSVLEIGSGAGSLSFFIAKSTAKSKLIDIDDGLVTKLQGDFKDNNNVEVLLGNALKFDYEKYTKIISNLPYYITSAILEKILLNASNLKIGVFMVQKEALTRIKSPLGTDDYGPLGILVMYRCELIKGFNVPRTSFVPAPHVESSVFVLKTKEGSDLETANKLYSLTSQLFLHKRKTVLNNLSGHLKDTAKAKEALEKANIPLTKRPQEISLEQYLQLLALL